MITRRYTCSVCGKSCGDVHLQSSESPGESGGKTIYTLQIEKFLGSVEFRLDRDTYMQLIGLYEKNDLHGVHDEFDLYAPFYCSGCGVCYCSTHWNSWAEFDEGFYDAEYGICPNGHKQILND